MITIILVFYVGFFIGFFTAALLAVSKRREE